jgi:hypothetical protein
MGDVRKMDARRAVRETTPDVVNQVRILAISEVIPNDIELRRSDDVK